MGIMLDGRAYWPKGLISIFMLSEICFTVVEGIIVKSAELLAGLAGLLVTTSVI